MIITLNLNILSVKTPKILLILTLVIVLLVSGILSLNNNSLFALAQYGSFNPNLPSGSPTSGGGTIIPQQQIEIKVRGEIVAGTPQGKAKVLIFSNTNWSGTIRDSNGDSNVETGKADKVLTFPCKSDSAGRGIYSVSFHKSSPEGYLMIVVIQGTRMVDQKLTTTPDGSVSISGNCQLNQGSESANEGGGCLISTAAYGSEMSIHVQKLRELRDNVLVKTKSGSSFISGFNQIYYSFSSTIADWERQNSIFKEVVKLAITPLITTLSILNYFDIDSETEVLGYGISLIFLNLGMYFVAPAIVVWQLKKRF